MKKSLSLLLSGAMVFGLFASAASAAESSDLTAQQKFDALKAKGIFAGMADGSAGLDQDMNRAQFARIAALLSGLDGIGVPDTKVVTEKPFTDVELGKWYTEEIAAVKEAELMVGNGDGTFGTDDKIQVQQLAVVVAKILGLEPVEDAEVEGAADWAAGYIQAIIDNGIDFPTNYTENATRAQLVEATYVANEILNPVAPAKVSVASAKATGVQKVTVTLDKAVDTEKAKFTLKKGTLTVALNAPVWSEDKKTAELPLKDVKISEGTYTVTLSGLDAESIDKASAEFTAENETVKAIEFVSASDQIAFTSSARVKLSPQNQYEELASFPASSYSVFTGYSGLGETLSKDDDGYLVLKLNTDAGGATPILTQGVSQLPVTVYFNDNRVTVSKTFKVGTAPFVTKIELGDVKYEGEKTSLTNIGETAEVPVYLYDQYGNPITSDQGVAPNFNQIVQPYTANVTADTQDFDSNNYYETRITLGAKESKAATYNVVVYAGGTSGTASVSVGAGKVATKVGFGEFDDVLASGDTIKHYVKVLAYDSEGNQLTADEMVDATNAGRINVTVNGPVTYTSGLITSGPHKGQIEILTVNANSAKQSVFITASISEIDANDFKTMNINIQDARIPTTMVLDSPADAKAVLGADSNFKILVKDQYGKNVDTLPANYSLKVSLNDLEGTPNIIVEGRDGNTIPVTTTLANGGEETYLAGATNYNKGFKFNTAAGSYGKTQFKAELLNNSTSLKTITQTIESINPANVDLFYSLKDVGDLYAAIDSNLLPSGHTAADNSKLAKKVEIKVKDAAGNSVAFPADQVQTVGVTNGQAVTYAKGDGATNDNDKFYLLGNKAGTATVTATVYSAKANGEVVSVSGTVTVKADPVTVETISAGNGDKDYTAAGTYDAYALMDLKVVDNYGIEYKTTNIDDYKSLLGITYTITGVKGSGTVSLNSTTNQITISGSVDEFTLTAVAPNGKTASTLVFH